MLIMHLCQHPLLILIILLQCCLMTYLALAVAEVVEVVHLKHSSEVVKVVEVVGQQLHSYSFEVALEVVEVVQKLAEV